MFEPKKFNTVSSQLKGGISFSVFCYLANLDTLTTLKTNGYFNPIRSTIRKNDVIHILDTTQPASIMSILRIKEAPIVGDVLTEEIPMGGVTDYNALFNKPAIDGTVLTSSSTKDALAIETTANKTTLVDINSTDTQYPTAKAVWTVGVKAQTEVYDYLTNQYKAYIDGQDALKVSKAGDTMTGALFLAGAPTADNQAATKKYIDDLIASQPAKGFSFMGFISSVAPTEDVREGNFWYTDSLEPNVAPNVTFPWTTQVYQSGAWSANPTPYIPTAMELWYDVDNGEAWYYIGDTWKRVDFAGEVFNPEQFDSSSGQITLAKGAILFGQAGTYTQGVDFDIEGLTAQQFFDANINNHYFNGTVEIILNTTDTTQDYSFNNITFDNTGSTVLLRIQCDNASFNSLSFYNINSDTRIFGTLTLAGQLYYRNCPVTYIDAAIITAGSISINAGLTIFANACALTLTTTFGLGIGGQADIYGGVTLSFDQWRLLANSLLTIRAEIFLTVLNTIPYQYNDGIIVDQRANHPEETFARKQGKFMGAPDYVNMENTNRITANNGTWTADRSGYVRCGVNMSAGGFVDFFVNNKAVSSHQGALSPANGSGQSQILRVEQGDIVKISCSGSVFSIGCYFIPEKLTAGGVPTVNSTVTIGPPAYNLRTVVANVTAINVITSWTADTDCYVIIQNEGTANDVIYFAYQIGGGSYITKYISLTGYRNFNTEPIYINKGTVISMVKNASGDSVTNLSILKLPAKINPPVYLESYPLLDYSTVEQDTGKKWVDGSPVMERTILVNVPALVPNTWIYVSGGTNTVFGYPIKNLISISVYRPSNNASYGNWDFVSADGIEFGIRAQASVTAAPAYLTIRYTK